MDRFRLGVLGPGLLWLALLGCNTTPAVVNAPPPDEYRLPPEDDPRFSQPPNYPRDVLNQGPTKKNYGGPGPGGMGGPGGGPRLGGAPASAAGPLGGPRGGSLANGGF